jgi:hypothetical protein
MAHRLITLTPDWQKVASAGQSIEYMQLRGDADAFFCITSSTDPTGTFLPADGLRWEHGNPIANWSPVEDLYAAIREGEATLKVNAR